MATLNVTNLQNVASTVTNVSLLADGTTSLVLNSTGTARTGGIRYNGGNLELYTGASWVPVAVGNFLPLAGGTMTGPITFAAGQTFPGYLPLAGGTMTGNLIPAATGQSGYWSRTGTTLAPATATDSVQVAAGTAAAPSLNFSGSATTGFFAPSAGAIGVSNAGTQSIEVDASGNVLIGGTLPASPNIELNASGMATFRPGNGLTANAGIRLANATNLAPAGSLMITTVDGTPFGVYTGAGTWGQYLTGLSAAWNAISDERHKDELTPITDGLNKVASLRAVTGIYKHDTNKSRQSFLIAQDVQAVLPEAVDTTDPDKLGLAYTDVIPLLVSALHDAKDRIEALEAEVAALKGA